jgi:hypothetical protein
VRGGDQGNNETRPSTRPIAPFLPTALASGQLLCGARQSSGIASLILLRDRDENAGVHKPQEGMMEIELVRESWGENEKRRDRWVDLYVGVDGPVRLSRHDLRPSLKGSSDAEDYEYHVNVPSAAVPKLVFALLRDKYLGAEVTPYKNFESSVRRKALNFGGDAICAPAYGIW